VKMTHVPYRNIAQYGPDLIAGQVPLGFQWYPNVAGPLQAKGAVPLAVAGDKRIPALPDTPTTTEAGLKDSAYDFWVGMFVPAKTPREIVERLHNETQKALDQPSVKDRYAKLGVEPLRMTTEEFAAYFRKDVEDTARLVKAAKIPTQER